MQCKLAFVVAPAAHYEYSITAVRRTFILHDGMAVRKEMRVHRAFLWQRNVACFFWGRL